MLCDLCFTICLFYDMPFSLVASHKNVAEKVYLFTCKRCFNAFLSFILISVLNSFHVLSTKLLHNPSLINMDYGAVQNTGVIIGYAHNGCR